MASSREESSKGQERVQAELPTLTQMVARVFVVLEHALSGRRWRWAVVGSVLLGSLFIAFPSYVGMDTDQWQSVFRTGAHPLTDLGFGQGSHQARLLFRPTVPFVGGLLDLGVPGYLLLQAAGGVALLAAFVSVTYRVTRDRVAASLLTAAFGLTYGGVVSFVELRGIFDGIALLLIVMAMVLRKPPAVALMAFLAAWTDERALLALGFVAVFWMLSEPDATELGASRIFKPNVLAVLTGAAAYLVTRSLVTVMNDLPSGLESGDGPSRVLDQLSNLPVGSWTGLEGLWVIVLLAAWVLAVRRDWITATILVGTTCGIVLFSMSVVDITRSMAYLAPAALACLPVLVGSLSAVQIRRGLLAAVTLSMAWPVYYVGGTDTIQWIYPLPLQLIRWATGQA